MSKDSGQGIEVEITGEFFRIGEREIAQAAKDIVQEMVEVGEQRLDKVLRPRPAGVYLSVGEAGPGKVSTGNYRRNIHGEARGLTGELNDSGIIYGPWLEGTSSRNASTRFKGYASFRRTKDFLEKEKAKIIDKHLKRAIERIS